MARRASRNLTSRTKPAGQTRSIDGSHGLADQLDHRRCLEPSSNAVSTARRWSVSTKRMAAWRSIKPLTIILRRRRVRDAAAGPSVSDTRSRSGTVRSAAIASAARLATIS